jgi:hypothetical protein
VLLVSAMIAQDMEADVRKVAVGHSAVVAVEEVGSKI